MDFIKKNLIVIVSALVGVLSLVAIFIGASRVSGNQELLAQAGQYLETISSIEKGVPVTTPDGKLVNLIPTSESVEKLKQVARVYKAQGYDALQDALRINIGYDKKTKKTRRQLIMDGIFPEPTSQDKPYKFRKAYRDAIAQLLKKLDAGSAPTEEDIERNLEIVAQDMGFLASETAKNKGEKSGGKKDDTEDDLEQSAYQKAIIEQAKKIKVYCDRDALDIIDEAYDISTGQPPLLEEMWWAQQSLWLQSDIVNAIAQSNSSAKDVTESVVKRILDIKMMHGYITEDGSFAGTDDPGLPESFTGMNSTKYYDIVRFSVSIIIDVTKIPSFIDEMYKQNYYTMYLCGIESVNTEKKGSMQGEDLYYYGPAPVVKFTSYWETYLLRDFYHWGIIGYSVDKKTGYSFLILYDGSKHKVKNIEDRTGLKGLMPKPIRDLISGQEQKDKGVRTKKKRRKRNKNSENK